MKSLLIIHSMARCNHLLALPFPAAAILLANSASAYPLANCAFCSGWNHPQPSRNHHLHISSLSYSALAQQRAHHFRLKKKKNCATTWKALRSRNSPVSASGRVDGGGDDFDDVSTSRRLASFGIVFYFLTKPRFSNRLCHQLETPCDMTSYNAILRVLPIGKVQK